MLLKWLFRKYLNAAAVYSNAQSRHAFLDYSTIDFRFGENENPADAALALDSFDV
jgi:hypothetical protein